MISNDFVNIRLNFCVAKAIFNGFVFVFVVMHLRRCYSLSIRISCPGFPSEILINNLE